LVSRVWGISLGIGTCFPLAGGGKRPKQRQPLLVLFKQQANPILSMKNFTPHVISWNDKQLTLLSQRKHPLTTRNTLVAL
jgi:hypothetical protein